MYTNHAHGAMRKNSHAIEREKVHGCQKSKVYAPVRLPFPKGVHAIDAHEGDLINIEVCQAYLVKRAQDALVQDVQKYHA